MAPIQPAPLPPSSDTPNSDEAAHEESATNAAKPQEEIEVSEEEEAEPVRRSDVIKILRLTRGEAMDNAKKSRVAFRAAREAADSREFKTITQHFQNKQA